MIAAETWMTAEAALAAGFVDELTDAIDLDLTLPGDVHDYFSSWYYEDDYWYARYDATTHKMRPEGEVFTASLRHVTAAGGKIVGSTGEPPADAKPNPQPDNINSDMSFLQKIVATLTRDGFMKKDQSAAAIDALEKDSPTFMAALVTEVKAQIETEAAPAPAETVAEPTPAKSLVEQLAELNEEELAAFREQIGVSKDEAPAAPTAAEVEAAEAREQELADLKAKNEALSKEIKAVTDQISTARAGRQTSATAKVVPPATNGEGGAAPAKPEAKKLDANSSRYSFVKDMYVSRKIDAKMFTQMTGHEAPARS